MAEINGLREIAYVDCKGGGQIEVSDGIAYVGHTEGPEATTIIDVKDANNPKILETVMCAHSGVHAHKVRVHDGIMLTNYESIAYAGEPEAGFQAGLNIYDVSDPGNPKHINQWITAGNGVHRFTYDGHYAYLSATVEGYTNRIVVIMDLSDPMAPEEVGRWWWPGQWTAGGEEPDIPAEHIMCHHPIRMGDKLYVSYWHAGWAILDISDMSNPTCLSRMSWTKTTGVPTHTCLPIPFPLRGMDVMLVADEDVAKTKPSGPAHLWMVNVSDLENPMPFASFQLDGLDTGTPMPTQTGCHQPVEVVRSTEIPVTWFENGLRVVDIADPHAPKEVASFVPDAPEGFDKPLGNDVYQDDAGIIYLIDRRRGLHLLERI